MVSVFVGDVNEVIGVATCRTVALFDPYRTGGLFFGVEGVEGNDLCPVLGELKGKVVEFSLLRSTRVMCLVRPWRGDVSYITRLDRPFRLDDRHVGGVSVYRVVASTITFMSAIFRGPSVVGVREYRVV